MEIDFVNADGFPVNVTTRPEIRSRELYCTFIIFSSGPLDRSSGCRCGCFCSPQEKSRCPGNTSEQTPSKIRHEFPHPFRWFTFAHYIGTTTGTTSIPGVILAARQRDVVRITPTMREGAVITAAGVDDVMLTRRAAVAAGVLSAVGAGPVEPVDVAAAAGPVMTTSSA